MTDSRLAGIAVEGLVAGTPDARLAGIAVEGLLTGTPDARLAGLTIEALIPVNRLRARWGVPMNIDA